MANSNPTSKSDQALAGATANALPVATAAGALAFDGNHTWNATTKSHVTKGVPLQVATLSTYSVVGNVVTLTATAPLGSGFDTSHYVTIQVSDTNTWLNGTHLIGGINAGLNQFVVSIVHADVLTPQGVTGTATVNPQTANLDSRQVGDGTDVVTVGPRGKVTLSGSVHEDGGVLDIISRNPNAPRIMRVYSAGIDDARFYIAANGGLYTHWEIVCSGSSSGSGADYEVLRPLEVPFMVGVWMDVATGILVRGTAIADCQAFVLVDQNGTYKFAITANDGAFHWGSSVNNTYDVNLYRYSAGVLSTDSQFVPRVVTGVSPNPIEIRGTGNALLLFVDSSGNPTISNANARFTLGNANQMALSHDNTNARAEVSKGNYSIAVSTAGKIIALEVEGQNRLLIDAVSCAINVPTTIGSGGTQIQKILSATATLDFGSISAGAQASLTISVTGAVAGNVVSLGPPVAIEAGLAWNGFVSAADTVTIRLTNTSASPIDPASATWRAEVTKY